MAKRTHTLSAQSAADLAEIRRRVLGRGQSTATDPKQTGGGRLGWFKVTDNAGELDDPYTGDVYEHPWAPTPLSEDKLARNVAERLALAGYQNSNITDVLRLPVGQWAKIDDYVFIEDAWAFIIDKQPEPECES